MGGTAGATGVVLRAFVTMHLKPSMYMLGMPQPFGTYVRDTCEFKSR